MRMRTLNVRRAGNGNAMSQDSGFFGFAQNRY